LTSFAARRIERPSGHSFHCVGNAALLDEPVLGFISSCECPGHALLETLDLVPEWVKADRIVGGGFHSLLEQQVLRSVLWRNGRVVKVLRQAQPERFSYIVDYQNSIGT
jgi:hypothetical protein